MTPNSRLDALLGAVRSRSALPAPRFAPSPGEAADTWLADIAHARAAADAAAVQHRQRVNAESSALFGQQIGDLIPAETHLIRRTISVPVRTAQLADMVPALANIAPRGPQPPVAMPTRTAATVRVTSTASPELGIIRLHGGAFWMGGGAVSSQIDGTQIDHIAATANAAVFDVDYALAPEYPYPAAVIDALCVLDAVRSGDTGWHVERTALMGTSSGANTAVLAARADALRQHSLSALALMVPSVLLAEAPPKLRADAAAWAARQEQLLAYAGAGPSATDAWISPGVEQVLTGMPPTFAAIAAHDEVAVGGAQLCAAINAGGSAAVVRSYEMTHTTAPPAVEAAVIRDMAEFLRDPVGFTQAPS